MRDVVEPGRDLGHVDRGKDKKVEEKKEEAKDEKAEQNEEEEGGKKCEDCA